MKKVLVIVISLFVLLFAGLWAYVANLDWNKHKDKIAAQIFELTGKKIVFDGSEQTGVDDTETWTGLNWSFANKSTDIVFTITVTNTNTERAITSTFDATSIQALNDVDGSTNIEVTVEQKGASDDDFTTFTNNTPVQIAAEGVLQYRITFSIADPNLSVDDQVWSNASITLNNVAA